MPIKTNLAQYSAAFIGLVGGIAHYLRNMAKYEMPFSMLMLFVNAFVSAFVAYTIGEALPQSWAMYNNAVAGFVGFFSYPILSLVEENFSAVLKSALNFFSGK